MPTLRRFPNLPEVHCRGEALGSPVHWLGLQWAVTADGVERRDGLYVIERGRIHAAENGHTWEDHIAAKGWADMQDFRAAMDFARKRWPPRRAIGEGPPARPGKLVAHLDMAVRPPVAISGELRSAGRTAFVELRRHGPKGRACTPGEQALRLPVAEIRAAVRILRQAEAKAVEKGLLTLGGSER